jgi:hypothetical protein
MNTKKHEMKNRPFDSEKGVGVFFSLFYYDTLKHDETVIRPTILYTFIDLMYALLASFTILTHDQRDEDVLFYPYVYREMYQNTIN